MTIEEKLNSSETWFGVCRTQQFDILFLYFSQTKQSQQRFFCCCFPSPNSSPPNMLAHYFPLSSFTSFASLLFCSWPFFPRISKADLNIHLRLSHSREKLILSSYLRLWWCSGKEICLRCRRCKSSSLGGSSNSRKWQP